MGVPEYLTREDVASRGGCGRDKVATAIKRGELPAVRIGVRVLVLREAAERWLRPVPIEPRPGSKSKAS